MRANIYSIGFIVSGSAMFLIIGILVFGSREPIHAPLQEANMPVAELRLDLQDVATLLTISQRASVKASLSSQSKRIERQIQRQEALIADGDRLYAAAVRHLGTSPRLRLAQAKLQLSAAKSAYQRAAAADKVETAALLEEQILEAERAAAGRVPAGEEVGGGISEAEAKRLQAAAGALRLPPAPNRTAAATPPPGAAPQALNATLSAGRDAALKSGAAAGAKVASGGGSAGRQGGGGGGIAGFGNASNASKAVAVADASAGAKGGKAAPAKGAGGGNQGWRAPSLDGEGVKIVRRGLVGPGVTGAGG